MPAPRDPIPHRSLLLLCAAALGSNLLSNALQGAMGDWIPGFQSVAGNLIATALIFALFYVVSILLYRHRTAFFPAQALREGGRPAPRQCVVMFLSPQSPQEFPPREGDRPLGAPPFTGDLEADVSAMRDSNPRWNWAPLLRGLLPHRTRVQSVHLLCSEKSLADRNTAAQLIRLYLPNVAVHAESGPLDFENYEQLAGRLKLLFHEESRSGRPLGEIVVDVTGGQKPTSIAGAAMTLTHPELVFQYVSTQPPDYQVTEYDLVQTAPAG